jgi:signal peptidase I
VDDAEQPERAGSSDAADLADRLAEVQKRADDLAARVAKFHAARITAPPAPAPTGLKRFTSWLFEQRPPRAAGPADAEEPVEPEEVEPAPGEPDSGPEPEPEATPRPRPYAGAPLVYDKATPAAAEPGDEFFTRADDDDTPKMWRDRKTDPKADKGKKGPNAGQDSARRRRRSMPKAARSALRLLVVVAVAVVAALLLRAYVVEPYYVPSQSMEPTLHGCPGCDNDHVLVEKLSYHFHDVQPGDIIVFNRPSAWHVPDKVLIKRVIGVAGDVLKLKGGQVFRNGEQLDEPYVNKDCKRGTTDQAGSIRATTYRVPKGGLFVMGDNRCDSEDSRFFGVVPRDKVIGRAFLIIWPFSRIHSL